DDHIRNLSEARGEIPWAYSATATMGGASCRSSHVCNARLATVGPKKAACRDGPSSDSCIAAKTEPALAGQEHGPVFQHGATFVVLVTKCYVFRLPGKYLAQSLRGAGWIFTV